MNLSFFAAVYALTNLQGGVTYYFDPNDCRAAVSAFSKRLIKNVTPPGTFKPRSKPQPTAALSHARAYDTISHSKFASEEYDDDNDCRDIVIVKPPDVYVTNYYNGEEEECDLPRFPPPRERGWKKYQRIGREHIERLKEERHERCRQRRAEKGKGRRR